MHPGAVAVIPGLCRFMCSVPVSTRITLQRALEVVQGSWVSDFERVWHASLDAGARVQTSRGEHSAAASYYKGMPDGPMPAPLVIVRDLTKEYRTPGLQPVTLFRNLNFTVDQSEMLAIVGESGAGKSTLLHLLAGLDAPTAGTVQVGGTIVSALNAAGQASFRNREVGYVWQAHYLLPEFTAAENVAMPLLARSTRAADARAAALRWLGEVGLAERSEHRAGELSGGEQQRVSLARALVGGPRLLLADEPTGNLDARSGEAIFALLQRVHHDFGTTTVLVTHNEHFAQRCDGILRLGIGSPAPLASKTLPFPPARVQ